VCVMRCGGKCCPNRDVWVKVKEENGEGQVGVVCACAVVWPRGGGRLLPRWACCAVLYSGAVCLRAVAYACMAAVRAVGVYQEYEPQRR